MTETPQKANSGSFKKEENQKYVMGISLRLFIGFLGLLAFLIASLLVILSVELFPNMIGYLLFLSASAMCGIGAYLFLKAKNG